MLEDRLIDQLPMNNKASDNARIVLQSPDRATEQITFSDLATCVFAKLLSQADASGIDDDSVLVIQNNYNNSEGAKVTLGDLCNYAKQWIVQNGDGCGSCGLHFKIFPDFAR